VGANGFHLGMVGDKPSLVILVFFSRFCDFLGCGVKNENHDFGKLGGLNPLKCFENDLEKLWEQKELILVWLVHSLVILARFCD